MSATILRPVYVPTAPNAYSIHVETGAERDLLLSWLGLLESGRHIGSFLACDSITESGVTLNVIVGGASLAARVALQVAFAETRTAVVLARVWSLPGCCAGIAQDLGRSVNDVREALDALAGAGLAYEVGAVWRAAPLARGGAA